MKCGHDPDAIVARWWTFTVDREVKSLNAHRVNAGNARFGYRRDRELWEWALRERRLARGIALAKTKRRVTLTRIISYRQRAFDRDNLIGGCKVVVDAMVREGLLLGDAQGQAEIHYEQEKRDGCRGLVVRIEELA